MLLGQVLQISTYRYAALVCAEVKHLRKYIIISQELPSGSYHSRNFTLFLLFDVANLSIILCFAHILHSLLEDLKISQ